MVVSDGIFFLFAIPVIVFNFRTDKYYSTVQHQPTGFYNEDGGCLLRGTKYIFKYRSH